MNLYELCYLNHTIDSKDIYYVPSFSELQFDNAIHQKVRESMHQNGYLDSSNTYTDKALATIEKIRQFKFARKYIVINNTAFGLNENATGVMLRQTDDDFTFYHLNMADSDRQLINAYRSFFNEQTMSVSKIAGHFVNPERFERQFSTDMDEYLTIVTVTRAPDKVTSTNEVFFVMNNKLYYYDFHSQLLITPDPVRVNAILKARLSI